MQNLINVRLLHRLTIKIAKSTEPKKAVRKRTEIVFDSYVKVFPDYVLKRSNVVPNMARAKKDFDFEVKVSPAAPKPTNESIHVVYRLEKDGIGPARHPTSGFHFRTRLSRRWDELKLNDHISYIEEGYWFRQLVSMKVIDWDDESMRFACVSLDALMQYWTPAFVEACLLEGFMIKAYLVKGDVHPCPANIQCVYRTTQTVEYQDQPLARIA